MLIKVFYDPRQSSPVAVSSPSATKPALLAHRWQERYPDLIEITGFEPVTREDFYLVHEKSHVDDILDCRKWNGFKNVIPEVAATFPWTTGSMVAAAFAAWKTKPLLPARGSAAPLPVSPFTCSLTSGFHHATWRTSGGFCTFNGLMVAAVKLLQAGAKKIGIVDCDCHYGNGTQDIIDRLKLHDQVLHYTFGEEDNYNPDWKGDERADAWLRRFPKILEQFAECDITLYQAGADAHAEDPLGGGLTTEQMIERDCLVFDFFVDNRIPVAWNLAGGYQDPIEKVLELHDNTLLQCHERLSS